MSYFDDLGKYNLVRVNKFLKERGFKIADKDGSSYVWNNEGDDLCVSYDYEDEYWTIATLNDPEDIMEDGRSVDALYEIIDNYLHEEEENGLEDA